MDIVSSCQLNRHSMKPGLTTFCLDYIYDKFNDHDIIITRQRGRVVKAMPCYLLRDIIGIVFARVGSNPAVVELIFAISIQDLPCLFFLIFNSHFSHTYINSSNRSSLYQITQAVKIPIVY
jgi:hypothetical protein